MKFLPQFIFRVPLNSLAKNVDDLVFSEALYLSSPSLYREYQKHLIRPLSDDKELKKMQISLYKYHSRASNRCTPFGLFAGLGVGDWDNESGINFNSNLRSTLKRKTRLDMNVLCSLGQELVKKTFISPFLKFYPNTSIYLSGNNYRYVEYYYSNNRRIHRINKVDFSDYLQYILEESKKGLSMRELIVLISNEQITFDEASGYIEELIDSQILVNNLEPTLTGVDYFDSLLINLRKIYDVNGNEELNSLINDLNCIDVLIKKTDTNIFNPIESYEYIYKRIKTILPGLSETNLFQTDMYKLAEVAKLNLNVQDKLKEATAFLNKITPPHVHQGLEKFRKSFQENYEENEIPLLTALDIESGIGYPMKDKNGINDLVDDIQVYEPLNENSIKWNLLQTHLLKIIFNAIKDKKKVVEISEDDFKEIDYSTKSLPPSYSVMFNVIDSKLNKIRIGLIGGISAVNLLGRFGGGDESIDKIIREIAHFEEQQMPGKIFAEIVHLPESRTGNVLARPAFRNYEIPYLAKSSLEYEFQVKMEDLVLKLKNDKIVLFDKRIKKEIMPKLGNAHNYSFNSLPVYHFLCDLQTQYFTKPVLEFNWGALANNFSFLPRVEYKGIILSPAKWQLKNADLAALKDGDISDEKRYDLFYQLKNRIELPVKFLLKEGDNELVIDSENYTAIDTFIDILKTKNELVLEEYLFNNEVDFVKDANANFYANECIAIVLNDEDKKDEAGLNDFKLFKSKQRFAIGSEWMYYKIYCGVKTCDVVLTEKIKPIADTLLKKGIINKWFFIRYNDPDVHLRLRMHVCDFEKYGEAILLINKELSGLIDQQVISKIQTDTYKRELSRYGDNSIEIAEELFFTDSIFVSETLQIIDTNDGSLRWKMALRSVDQFLNDFNFSLDEKFELMNKFSVSFFNEHGGKKNLKLLLDNKFREFRTQINEVLDIETEKNKEYYPVIQLIYNRSASNRLFINKLYELNAAGDLHLSINDLISSLLHMNINRIFMGRNRTNEYVIYDLLTRYYKSSIARTIKNQKKGA